MKLWEEDFPFGGYSEREETVIVVLFFVFGFVSSDLFASRKWVKVWICLFIYLFFILC